MGNVQSIVDDVVGWTKIEEEGSSVDPDPKDIPLQRQRTTSVRDNQNIPIKSPLQALQIDGAWDALRKATEDHLQERGSSIDFTPDSFDIENDLGLERPIKIAILDTGVDLDHEALIGRVVRLRNFVPRWFQEDATDDLQRDRAGRGTFLAALAVGGTYEATSDGHHTKDPAFRNGVAPFAKLVVGKVLSDQGKGDVEWLVKGLKWACDIEKTDSRRLVNADIICITSGVSRYSPDLRLVITEAIAKGKLIICASNSDETGTSYDIHYPARFGDVICVESHTENGTPSVFSPPGRETEFLAPGEDIWSASPRGPRRITRKSGPFVPVPYCAGVCALIIAYAEKVGGQELRRVVTHTQVMKKILKRASSTIVGTHHDPLSGFGNILPGRLLKYGSDFFVSIVKDIFGVRDRGFTKAEHQATVSADPMKPTIREFNASHISSRMISDRNLSRTLLGSMFSDKALHHWYTGLEILLTKASCEDPNIPMPKLGEPLPSELDLVDFSMPPITSNLTMTITGINVERCIETYFSNYNGQVRKIILPEYRYVAQLDRTSRLNILNPCVVHIPGTVPVHYLFRVMNSLSQKEKHTDVIADVLDIDSLAALYPNEISFIHEVLERSEQLNMKVYCKEIIGDCPEEFEKIILAMAVCGSETLKKSLQTKFDFPDVTDKEMKKTIFYLQAESLELAVDETTLPESSRPEEKTCFRLKHELTKIFLSINRNKVLKEYPRKAKLLRNTVMRSYEGALNLLRRCNMAEVVTCIDIRFDELNLEIPKAELEFPDVDDDTMIRIPQQMRSTSYLSIADTRTALLAPVLKDILSNTKSTASIEELIIPPVFQIQDLAETMSSPLLKHCKNVFIPGETAFVDLLLILRNLPREEYPITLHVQHLRLTMLIGTTTSRDFECPPGIKIVVYQYMVDYTFLQVPVEKAAGIYEILLRFSSCRLLELIRDNCKTFINDPDDRLLPFNCYGSYTACRTLLTYFEEALNEDMIEDDQSILQFSSEVFKFRYITAATGPQQFRLAFKPSEDSEERQTLSPNFYRPVLMENRALLTKWRQGKLRDIVVAVFGLGINAYHPEFYSKTIRDINGSFGDKILGLAYNAVPEDCLQSFVDDDCTIGTVAAALIAGSTCGAAPFSKVVSIKVGRSSGHCRPDWMVSGLKYLIQQEEKGLLPQSDVVFIPFTFGSFDFDMYKMVNQLVTSGKIIVCAAGKSSVLDSEMICYPACYGDVLCVGSHQSNGEPSAFTGKGRETDLLALGEVPCGGDLNEQWGTAIAAAHVTGVVAYILAYAETIGGPSLRQVISNNSVMREILRGMCSKPGQHDEKSGYGILNPGQILRHGDDYFRQMVSELTEEYSAIIARRTSVISQRKVVHSSEEVPKRKKSVTTPPTTGKVHLLKRMASMDVIDYDQAGPSRSPGPSRVRPRRRGYSESSTGSGVSDL